MDKGGYMKKEPEEMKKINLKHSPGIENLKAILEASKTSKEGEHKMQDFIEKNKNDRCNILSRLSPQHKLLTFFSQWHNNQACQKYSENFLLVPVRVSSLLGGVCL